MLKKKLFLVASVGAAALLSQSASAAETMRCDPPVIQVAAGEMNLSKYTVPCQGAEANVLAPRVVFTGDMPAHGTPPYAVKAQYTIDARDLDTRVTGAPVRDDQVFVGALASATVSVAALPAQFSSQLSWDASSSVLSIEEAPGRWRIVQVRPDDFGAASMSNAGTASAPVKNGRTSARLAFDSSYSRFAGKGQVSPVIHAELGLRDGKLEFLVGETAAASQKEIEGALQLLDRKPADMTRAWGLGARAKFLDNADLVRYAEQKVAAHNPHLLEEFQLNLARVKPYVLPKD